MTPLLLTIDQMLRAEGLFRAAAGPVSMSIRQRVRTQLWVIAACGMVYGACMGSFGGVFGDGPPAGPKTAVPDPGRSP